MFLAIRMYKLNIKQFFWKFIAMNNVKKMLENKANELKTIQEGFSGATKTQQPLLKPTQSKEKQVSTPSGVTFKITGE